MAVTVTRLPKVSRNGTTYEKVKFEWTSDGSGAASQSVSLHGFLVKAITVPSTSAAPTDLYDITLVDPDSTTLDALDGDLANRATATDQQVYPVASGSTVPVFLCGDYTFTIANAGATTSGTCLFYLYETL